MDLHEFLAELRTETGEAFPRASQALTADHVQDCVDFEEYLATAPKDATPFREFFFGPDGPLQKNNSLKADFGDVDFADPAAASRGGKNAGAARRRVKNAAAGLKLRAAERRAEEQEEEEEGEEGDNTTPARPAQVAEGSGKGKGRAQTPKKRRQSTSENGLGASTSSNSLESQLVTLTAMLQRMESEREKDRKEREKEREEMQALYQVVLQRELKDELSEKARPWTSELYKIWDKIIFLLDDLELETSHESDVLRELVTSAKKKMDDMWETAQAKKKKDAAAKKGEDKEQTAADKRATQATCWRCGKKGHYSTRCTEPAPVSTPTASTSSQTKGGSRNE